MRIFYLKIAPILTFGSLCFSALIMISDAKLGALTDPKINKAAETAAVSYN